MRISDWSSDVCSSDLLLDRDLDIGWRAGIATVFRGLGLADAEGAVEDEENGEGGRRRDEAGDKTSRVVPGEKVEHRVSLSACAARSEEHTSELQSLMRISYAVFCLKKKKKTTQYINN